MLIVYIVEPRVNLYQLEISKCVVPENETMDKFMDRMSKEKKL